MHNNLQVIFTLQEMVEMYRIKIEILIKEVRANDVDIITK